MMNGLFKLSRKQVSCEQPSSDIDKAEREDTPMIVELKEGGSVGGVVAGYSTDAGPRPKNDDFGRFEVFDDRLVCALSDGIGGASFGNMASRVASLSAIRHLRTALEADAFDDPSDALMQAIARADDDVCELKRLIGTSDDGSTLIVALQDSSDKGAFDFAWVGDTIAYHYIASEETIVPVGEPGRVAAGDNRLDGALGYHADVARLVKHGAVRMAEGDLVVMCTDGVWDVPGALDAKDVSELAQLSPETTAQRIVELAIRDLSGSDNATAIVIKALPELF